MKATKPKKHTKSAKRKVQVDYEGMGTYVEADIIVDGKFVCVIYSRSVEANDLTAECVQVVRKYLEGK